MGETIRYKVEVDTTAAHAATESLFTPQQSMGTASAAPVATPQGNGPGGAGIVSPVPNFSYISGIPGAQGYGAAGIVSPQAQAAPQGAGPGGAGIVSGLASTTASGLFGGMGVAGSAAAGGALGVALEQVVSTLIQIIPSAMMQSMANEQAARMGAVGTAMGSNPMYQYAAEHRMMGYGVPLLSMVADYHNQELQNHAQFSAGLDTLQQGLGNYNPTIAGLNIQQQYFETGMNVQRGQRFAGPLSERQRYLQMLDMLQEDPNIGSDIGNLITKIGDSSKLKGMRPSVAELSAAHPEWINDPRMRKTFEIMMVNPTSQANSLESLKQSAQFLTDFEKEYEDGRAWDLYKEAVKLTAEDAGLDPMDPMREGAAVIRWGWDLFASKAMGDVFGGQVVNGQHVTGPGMGYQGGRGGRDVAPTIKGATGMGSVERQIHAGGIPRPTAAQVNMHFGENMQIQAADEERLSHELLEFANMVRGQMGSIHDGRWWRTFVARHEATARF